MEVKWLQLVYELRSLEQNSKITIQLAIVCIFNPLTTTTFRKLLVNFAMSAHQAFIPKVKTREKQNLLKFVEIFPVGIK
jgi:hypothetical protein